MDKIKEELWPERKVGVPIELAEELAPVIESYGGECRYWVTESGSGEFRISSTANTLFCRGSFTKIRVHIKFDNLCPIGDTGKRFRFYVDTQSSDISLDNVGSIISQMQTAQSFLRDTKDILDKYNN